MVLKEGGFVCFLNLCHHPRGLDPAERDVSAHGCYFAKHLPAWQPYGAGTILIMTIPILLMRIQEMEQFAQVHKALWALRTQAACALGCRWILESPFITGESLIKLRPLYPRILNCKVGMITCLIHGVIERMKWDDVFEKIWKVPGNY